MERLFASIIHAHINENTRGVCSLTYLFCIFHNDLFNAFDEQFYIQVTGLTFGGIIYHKLSRIPSLSSRKGTQDLYNRLMLFGTKLND
jgi:hypothetical protein